MASLLDDPVVRLARLSVEQYHRMIECGALTEDDPFELYEGVLVETMPEGPIHAARIMMLIRQLVLALGDAPWLLRAQNPITLGDSEPEPDLAIVIGGDYLDAHPGPGDIAVVIEVSASSLVSDRTTKQRIYARAGIERYLIVNLVDHVVEVFTEPAAGDEPHYASSEVVRSGPVELGPITVDAADLIG